MLWCFHQWNCIQLNYINIWRLSIDSCDTPCNNLFMSKRLIFGHSLSTGQPTYINGICNLLHHELLFSTISLDMVCFQMLSGSQGAVHLHSTCCILKRFQWIGYNFSLARASTVFACIKCLRVLSDLSVLCKFISSLLQFTKTILRDVLDVVVMLF